MIPLKQFPLIFSQLAGELYLHARGRFKLHSLPGRGADDSPVSSCSRQSRRGGGEGGGGGEHQGDSTATAPAKLLALSSRWGRGEVGEATHWLGIVLI